MTRASLPLAGLAVAFAALVAPACAHQQAFSDHGSDHGSEPGAPRWTYAGDSGPSHWAELSPAFAACGAGHSQSPVDIAGGTFTTPVMAAYTGASTVIVNNGFTIQVNVAEGNRLRAEGAEYELLQLHFHSPSEHKVQGRSYPLEAHFVHRNRRGHLAVVGLLFREGDADERLAPIWSAMPARAGNEAPFAIPLARLWDPSRLAYAAYDGSLTTPPCTEGVRWYVAEAGVSVSAEQAARLVGAVGANARPLQPRDGRGALD